MLQLNSKIPDYHRLLQLEGGQLNGDQYLSGFVNVCNPFDGAPNYSYVPESCPKNAIPIGHLPHVSNQLPITYMHIQKEILH